MLPSRARRRTKAGRAPLNCCRALPDLEAALSLAREIAESSGDGAPEWVAILQTAVAEWSGIGSPEL